MKKLFAILALVLGMVSCQTEPEGLDVVVGGEQDVNITVSLPEGTRANSALGAFGNVNFDEYDVRFQCEVHYGDQVKVLPVQISDNGKSATFPVRLIANRDYKFVVWADLVLEDSTTDLHYNTSTPDGLANISINDWAPMDETRDAYTCSEVHRFERNTNITLTLKRPFAKLRVITTDMDQLMGVMPTSAKVVYTTDVRTTFNAVEGKAGDANDSKTHELFNIASYGESSTDKTLFADYLFVGDNDIVNFHMNIYDTAAENTPGEVNLIDEQKNFITPIPVKRNHVTTIKGNILTYADDFDVTIDDGFENADDKIEDIPYYYAAVTNGADLLKAISEGREIIALNDIVVTEADKNFEEAVATRSNSTAKNPVLNLNGFTITIENNGAEALVDLQGGVLTVEGNGAIESTTGALVETIYNVGEATIAENAATEPVVNCLSEIRAAFANGDEYTMVCDVVYPETLVLEAGKSLVLNLNGKTLSQSKKCTGNYNMIYNKGNLTINGDGAISFKDTGAGDPTYGWGSYTIRNEGKLVVNGGTIEHLGEQEAHMRCAIFQYSGSSVINGGVISTPTYRSARLWGGDMTINGGNFEGQLWLQAMNNTSSDLTINGGTFAPRGGDGSSVYVTNNQGDVTFAVTGGHFTTKIGMYQPFGCITGGTFTTAAKEATSEELLAEGCEFVEENGVWVVKAYEVVTTVEELEKAIKAGKNVILGADIALDAPIQIEGKSFSINGNGFKIGQSSNYPAEGTAVAALIHPIGGEVTIKNVVFDSIKNDAAIRTAGTKILLDNITVTNCKHTKEQGLLRLLGQSTIKNSTFSNNTCTMVVSLNFDGNGDVTSPQVVENCEFIRNTCNTTAVLYYAEGGSATINGNKFVNNTLNVSNGATVYLGFKKNCTVTNNLFDGNTVTATSKRSAGGLMVGNAAVVTGNAFVNNTVTVNGATGYGNDVCASPYYAAIDLSGNYWGGGAPVENDDYYKEYNNYEVIINDYLTTNPIK